MTRSNSGDHFGGVCQGSAGHPSKQYACSEVPMLGTICDYKPPRRRLVGPEEVRRVRKGQRVLVPCL
jgi:hypothetical protein